MQIFLRLRRLGALLMLAPLCLGLQPGMAAQRTQDANVVNVVSFAAPPAAVTNPPQNVRGNLLLADDGNIYFTSSGGGNGYGTISRLTPDGTLSVVFAFADGNDGYGPFAGLIQGSDGNLYGTSYYGGKDLQGSVFKVTPAGNFTLLYQFSKDGNGPKNPYTGLVQASDGNFYGTTRLGGNNGVGTIFRISSSGTLAVLHEFNGDDGNDPQGRLVVGPDGQLYGTTMRGGPADRGVIYRISVSGDYQVLYTFPGLGPFNEQGLATNDIGANPRSGLLLAADGNFYGTAYQGGQYGSGTLYRATVSGNAADVTVVHAFKGWSFDAGYPLATPVEDAAGNFYGTSEKGGYTQPWRGMEGRARWHGHAAACIHRFVHGRLATLHRRAVCQRGDVYGEQRRPGLRNWVPSSRSRIRTAMASCRWISRYPPPRSPRATASRSPGTRPMR